MNNYFNKMKVELTVVKINTKESHSCNVRVAMEINGKMEVSIIKNCFISGLTKYRFLDKNNLKFEIGKKYTSENTSKKYEDCPISLRRTCSRKTGKEMFALQVVNEGKTYKNTVTSPKGKEITSYTFTTIPPSKWYRYSDYYAKNLKRYKELNLEKAEA